MAAENRALGGLEWKREIPQDVQKVIFRTPSPGVPRHAFPRDGRSEVLGAMNKERQFYARR